jgi:uncharacterized protein (DUF433 family)
MAARSLDSALTVGLYALGEAADIVDVPRPTFHTWARRYRFKGLDGRQKGVDGLITTLGPGRGQVVPFVGLGEAYVLAAFRAAGVPMQRIRPAINALEREFGMHTVLASEQLMTDGAEVLWKFGEETRDSDLRDRLVVARNNQLVFREVVEQFLRTITYRDGVASLIRLPSYAIDVVVDPRRNFGQPTVASRGVRVADVRSRLAAGEPAQDVADDYGMTLADVRALAA